MTLVPVGGRGGRDRRDAGAAGDRDRGHDGDRGDGLDRARPQRARGPAGRLRPRLPGVRAGGGDPLRVDPVPRLGGTADRHRPRVDAPARDRVGAGGLRDRGAGVGRRVDRAARHRRRPRFRPPGRARDRGRVDRARLGGRLHPGRHRARRGLRDHRRRRGGAARGRGARSGGLGPGPDVDPGVRRHPQRVRGVGRGHKDDVLHGSGGGPSRLGDPVTGASP